MRVSVFVNTAAGRAKPEPIKRILREALHRCELDFHIPETAQHLQDDVKRAIRSGSEALIICGGDGTLNLCLQSLVEAKKSDLPIPPILNLPVGTANDLATEVGIRNMSRNAARALFEGRTKWIDVIEVSAGGTSKYMITNGGLGIPAQTVEKANKVKSWVKRNAARVDLPDAFRLPLKAVAKIVESTGPRIYEMLFVSDVLGWSSESWDIEIIVPGKTTLRTRAPLILISNQPNLGHNFVTAPLTSNTDGTFAVLLIEPQELLPQTLSILDIRSGRLPDGARCPSFEAKDLRLRSLGTKKLSFFGDGEILFQNVSDLHLSCLHPGVPVISLESSSGAHP